MSALQSVLGSRVISYHAIFTKMLRSAPAGIMLSQACWVQEEAKHTQKIDVDGAVYFSLTAEQWYELTGITSEQQATARELLKSGGFWKEIKTGLPARLYTRIDFEALQKCIENYKITGLPVSVKAGNKFPGKPETCTGKSRKLGSGNPGILRDKIRDKRETNNTNKSGEFFPDQEAEKKEAPPVPQPPPQEKKVADLKTAIEVCAHWSTENPDQVRYWKETARKTISDEDLKTEIGNFFSYYFRTTESDAHICRTNPLKFYQDGFFRWLTGIRAGNKNEAVTGQNKGKSNYKQNQYAIAERVIADRERLNYE